MNPLIPIIRRRRRAAGAAPTLPADFLAAVKASFLASPAAALVPGGFFTAAPGKTAAPPYVVFSETSASASWKSSTSRGRTTNVQLKLYGDDPDALSPAGDAIEDWFAGRTLAFSGGITGPFAIGPRDHSEENGMSNAGFQGWSMTLGFAVQVIRRGA